MIDPSQLKKHADLFTRMGDAVGVDLQEKAIKGHLRFDEIAEAVIRCTHCGQPGACQTWLKAHQNPPVAAAPASVDHAPNYCRNRDLFDFLKEDEA